MYAKTQLSNLTSIIISESVSSSHARMHSLWKLLPLTWILLKTANKVISDIVRVLPLLAMLLCLMGSYSSILGHFNHIVLALASSSLYLLIYSGLSPEQAICWGVCLQSLKIHEIYVCTRLIHMSLTVFHTLWFLVINELHKQWRVSIWVTWRNYVGLSTWSSSEWRIYLPIEAGPNLWRLLNRLKTKQAS